MGTSIENDRFEQFAERTSYPRLDIADQDLVRHLFARHRLTFQELRIVSQAALDLTMWGETPLHRWWPTQTDDASLVGRELKKKLLRDLALWMTELRGSAKTYPEGGLEIPRDHSLDLASEAADRQILGQCPVASDETVCCNLWTIDPVQNCGFGCSYCTIQTFFGDRVVFDADLGRHLETLELDPERFYHIGTGQSSDSLMWGNRAGILDALCDFARRNPNILLELKTKSKNVDYFLDRPAAEIPSNLVLSWSLNTPTIVRNEEHFTATATQRLAAARRAADHGLAIAFHFHPIVHYDTWRRDYRDLADEVIATFSSDEVLFLSFGTLTFIKPVMKAIRARQRPTKVLQMDLVPGAKGKLSYPEALKKRLFSHLHDSFAAWHERVFMYLCMEEAEYWHSTFGFSYPSNAAFESDFARAITEKIDVP